MRLELTLHTIRCVLLTTILLLNNLWNINRGYKGLRNQCFLVCNLNVFIIKNVLNHSCKHSIVLIKRILQYHLILLTRM